MKKIFTLLFTFLASISLISAQCDHIFRMNDSFGDGWNGASVDIVVGTTTVVTGATITAGATGDQLFSASTGDAISLANWVSGSWNSEITWEVLDGTGAVVASGAYGDLTVGSGACPPSPVCDHIFRMNDSFGDGWNGASVDIVVGTTTVVTGATITAGATGDQLFSASTGDAISLANWVSGSWNSEITWELLDGGGTVIATGAYGDVTGGTGNCPSCSQPSGLTASNVTSSDATLNWTAGGSETQWNIEYGAVGYTQGAGTAINAVTTNPYTLSGLSAGVSYDIYIQADCGTATSTWVGPVSITTIGDCSSAGSYTYADNESSANATGFIANNPGDYITINFSAGSTEAGWDYWFINDAADGSGNTIATGDGSIIGTYESTTGEISFYVDSDGSFSPGGNGLAGSVFDYTISCSSPPSCVTPTGLTASNITGSSADLSWTAGGTEPEWNVEYGNSGFGLGSGTSSLVQSATTIAAQTPGLFTTGPNATWTNVYTACVIGDGNNGIAQTLEINITNLPAGGANARKVKTVANGNFNNGPAIPLTLGLNTLDVAAPATPWGDRTVKFQFSSDAVEFSSMSINGTSLYSGGPNLSLTGLTSNTTYDYYVQAQCTGGDTSAWAGPFSFTTPCNIIVAPYCQNFDALTPNDAGIFSCITTDNMGDCWVNDPANTNNWTARSAPTGSTNTGPSADHTSGSGNYAFLESSSCPTNTSNLWSGEMDVSALTNPEARFWYHMYGATMGSLSVYASTDGGTTWSASLWNQSGDQQDQWREAVIDMSAYAGATSLIVRFEGTTGTSFTSDMAIDDFCVQEEPCINTTGTDAITACDSYTWIDGVNYTSSNNSATFVLTNAAGCDSTVTLDLTINNSSSGTDVITACDSYTWIDGVTYTESTGGGSSPTTISNQTPGLFTNGSTAWPHIYTACTNGDGNGGVQQELVINVTSLPSGGANYSIAKTVANGNFNYSGATALSLGLNTLTVAGVTFERTVKFRFSSGDVEFDALSLNGSSVYTPQGSAAPTFVLTNAAGCDSTVTLDLTINNSSSGTDVITACDSYTWIDGVTYTESTGGGSSATTISNQTPGLFTNGSTAWPHIYTACTNGDGNGGVQQELVINVTSLPSGGANYSIAKTVANGNFNYSGATALSLGVNTLTVAGVTFERTVKFRFSSGDVEFDALSLNGSSVYTPQGSAAPTFVLTNAAGCDSTVTLDLTINNSSSGTDVITACDSYTWIDGVNYTSSNNSATFVLTNASGCDSTVTLDLTINNSSTSTDVIAACGSYTWIDGATYTSSNNSATFVLTNAAGCDSTVTLDLTINNSSSGTDVITACDSYTWIDGVNYTSSNNSATFVLTNAAGCDSTVTLDLTINNSSSGTDVITACDSYTWIDGVNYTSSNNSATFVLTNAAGCDSTVTLDLTINNSSSGTDVITACDSYTWIDGVNYTSSNNSATFVLTNAAGCDSTVTLDLTINNSSTSTDVIAACGSYTWIDGATYTSSNNSATFVLTNAAGCDSTVTLDLTINNSSSGTDVITACDSYTWIDGVNYTSSNNSATFVLTNAAGCDSTVTLDLTINNSSSGTDVITACDSYTWIDGVNYTSSNNSATFVLTNAAGCDSTVTLDLTINNSSSGTDVITACDSYTWIDGVNYTSSNNSATFVLTNAAGCDSTVTLDLTINNSSTSTDVIAACGSYTWIDGATYTSSNNSATFVLTNAAGCDSTVTLDLTINNSSSGTDVITACDSYTWIDGATYTSSNNSATFVLTNAAGCDSTVTLDLTINNSSSGTDVITACDSYTWIDGVNYTSSNNSATFVLTNTAGCDSTVTLDLTINNSSTSTDVITACGSYTWIDGATYTSSNNSATFVLTNAAGCDSTVTLDLTINSVDVSITNSSPTLTANAIGATYQWVNCDSSFSLILNETNQDFTATSNGNYAVIVTENNCVDTSACETVNNVGLNESNSLITVYPNPSSDQVNIQIDGYTGPVEIKLYDLSGKLLEFTFSRTLFLKDYSRGVYIIRIYYGDFSKDVRVIRQ